jgi:site-specific DNA-methyltransferase (adenine-specific)
MPISIVENRDCIEAMKEFPDKFFELAIVDPPYGIGEGTKQMYTRHHSQRKYAVKEWDRCPPDRIYFDELFRISKNQIIWGANHFISKMPFDSSCWIFWDKDRFGDFADGELAWTSFKTAVRYFKYTWDGSRKERPQNRIHPTEKPYGLYQWLLKNYAKPGDKILDTHLGSGSSRIVAYKMGFDFWGYEIDKDYFDAQEKRFKEAIAQPLFDSVKSEQGKLL